MTKTVHVLYFASLGEKIERDNETIELPDNVQTLADLKQHLSNRGPIWQETLLQGVVKSAIDQSLCSDADTINDGNEIAFFPPVTGG